MRGRKYAELLEEDALLPVPLSLFALPDVSFNKCVKQDSTDLIACRKTLALRLGLSVETSHDLSFKNLCLLCLEFGFISQTTSDIILKYCTPGNSSKTLMSPDIP